MNQWLLFGICSAFVILIIYPLYSGEALENHPAFKIAIKGLGTFIAAGLAFYGALRIPDSAAWLIFAGLAVCAVADMALAVRFKAGVIVFLTGHLVYLCAYLNLAPPQPASLLIFVLLYTAVLASLYKEISKMGKEKFLLLLYGAVLLLMLSVALLLPVRAGARGLFAAVGACLFVASDFVLAKKLASPPSTKWNYAVMGLYYSAQLILSLISLRPWIL